MDNVLQVNISLLLLLLLLQATYLRAAKVNHIGESEARLYQPPNHAYNQTLLLPY